ncbi:MAG: T9SS type A sorting domain-containing protein [Bacteroidaceae bacterium]|nr:T9SS type A sorting domain-containing protein [Bacteroidaceae bacterium]
MKRILFLLSVLLALSAYAEHEYIPFVEDGKVWVDYNYQGKHNQLGINGTTTIDQKEYYKLYIESFSEYGGTQTPTDHSQLHGYIREENKRVYRRSINDEQEHLIYDFGAQVGDTIEWDTITYTWSEDTIKRYIVVDSIKTTLYYGKERNVYYVTCIEREFDKNGVENFEHGGPIYFYDEWIEGVGTLRQPSLDDSFRWGATGMIYFEYCYDYNTQEIFPTNKTPRAEFSYPGEKYIPCLQEGNAWVFENTPPGLLVQRHIGSTKVIDGVEYHVLYKTIFYPQSWSAGEPIEAGYMREENGKVYMGAGEKEKLIIDFTLQKGDTAYWDTDKHVYIKDVSYSVIAEKERKVMQVETRGLGPEGETTNNETWIEGIGTTHNIFDAESYRWYDFSGLYTRFKYFYNYPTQTCYPENAEQFDFGTQSKYEYIPFLQEGNAWVQESIESDYGRNMITDTVTIDGKEYCVLSFRALNIYESIIWDSHYKTYLREEGKKVYRYHYDESFVPTWNNTEHLFFDFGAQAGDSIVVADWEEYKLTLVIDSVCQKVLDNKERDVFYVSYMKLYKEREETYIENHDVWIEGIGPTQTATFDEMVCKWGLACGASLFYCYHNYNTGYTYPEDKTMIDFSAVHATPADANTLTLHRNGNALMAVFPTASAGDSITLYDTTGRVVATQAVQQGATTATIDITALPAGVYIARLNSGATAKVVL